MTFVEFTRKRRTAVGGKPDAGPVTVVAEAVALVHSTEGGGTVIATTSGQYVVVTESYTDVVSRLVEALQ